MTGFVVGALVTLALTLALLLRPFYLRQGAAATASQRQLNTAILREQLAKLEQDLTEGTLGVEDYGQARAELQRRVLQDTTEADAAPTLRAPRRTMLAVGLTVPAVALGMYMLIGNPASMTRSGRRRACGPARTSSSWSRRWRASWRRSRTTCRAGRCSPARTRCWGAARRPSWPSSTRAPIIDNDAQALANYADVAASNAGGASRASRRC